MFFFLLAVFQPIPFYHSHTALSRGAVKVPIRNRFREEVHCDEEG